MSEGFHVCNRSRRHCPILVMSPEPNGFEERINHRIVITISLAAHRDLEAVLGQALLILI